MEVDVRALAQSLIGEVVDSGRADLYETLAKPLPLLMITLLLGIERDELFWEATDTLMYGRLSGAREAEILTAARDLYAFMERQIERRRAEPGDDLISLMMTGDVDGRPYTRRGGARPVRVPPDRGPREHRVRHPRHPAPSGRAPGASRGGGGRPGRGAQPGRAVASPVHAGDGARAHRDV